MWKVTCTTITSVNLHVEKVFHAAAVACSRMEDVAVVVVMGCDVLLLHWNERKRRTHHKSFNYMCAEQRDTALSFHSFEYEREKVSRVKSAVCEINEWWHFWWIRIDNRRHFMLLNISTSHKQTSLAIFHIMQNKFHTSTTTATVIICVSLSSLQFFIFYFVSIDNSVFFSCKLFMPSAVFAIAFVQCVELLAWKSFHLWNFSTCFFRNDWRQDTSNVPTLLFAWTSSYPMSPPLCFDPLQEKTWWHEERQFWCCHQSVLVYFCANEANKLGKCAARRRENLFLNIL